MNCYSKPSLKCRVCPSIKLTESQPPLTRMTDRRGFKSGFKVESNCKKEVSVAATNTKLKMFIFLTSFMRIY